ncbi:phenylalanine--tRNA ligase subunit beta [Odoribacter sp. OttesenSCG-928-G04]|nr:phenylalanine--tRNA ligase subunit beta [Odoribacter sp. OttesenSCG-928-G04]
MNISLNWLNDYLKTDLNAEEIAEILTSVGLEVSGFEKFESIKGGLQGLVIGEVKTCVPHPDSDHLNLTTVDLGNGNLTPIVCGAPNVAAGQKVVVATIGTILYDGDKEFTIKKSKIRGQESEGMICSETEIGIGNDQSGIIVLPADAQAGTPAAEYYNITNDYVIGIDITPNRITGASHLGVARDLSAYLKQRGQEINYTLPSVDTYKTDLTDAQITIDIQRPEACKRYAGVCIQGVEVKESPEWLRNRLKAIGLNPINNIVDVTNYVLFELGQPLHAFDKDKIAGNKVVLRSYPTGTPFTTLDGVERKLDENDLMVCDEQKPMCIAGVFGGTESGITENTQNVFLESAYFDSVFVRKTARRHGLNTDASFHFERGTDPNIVIYALKRAALLIKEVAGGKIASEIVDVYPTPVQDTEIAVKYNYITGLIGKDIDHNTIKGILTALEMKIVQETEEGLVLQVPPYHVDVKQAADVVEEVLRIYGFNNIELPSKLNSTLSYSHKPDDYALKNMISNMLASNGFNEMINNSLTKADYYKDLETYSEENTVLLHNPLSSDLNAMRQGLLFGGLEVISYNINRKNPNLRLFEFGKAYTFHKKDTDNPLKQYKEEDKLAIFISGNKTNLSWNSKETRSDFFTIKSYGEMVVSRMGLNPDHLNVEENDKDLLREGLNYSLNGKHILTIGALSGKLLKKFDIEQDVYYAELSWENILNAIKNLKTTFSPLPKYPSVKRDLALLLDKKVSFKEVKDIAWRTEKKLLKAVHLFDVYEGEKLGEGKKSYAVSFTIQDEEKTLTDNQIDKIMNKLIGSYKHQLGAEIR